MEKMAQEGIHYVVGPNVDDGAAAVRPVAEQNDIIYFPYAFPKSLYVAPASNAVLGMVANYQSGPAIYKYLKENKGVQKIAFVAANESDPLSQRDGGVEAAKALGLDVVSSDVTYQVDTTDFTPGAPAGHQDPARPPRALRRRARPTRRSSSARRASSATGADLHRDRPGRHGARAGRGRARQRLHLRRRRLDPGDRLGPDEGIRRPLHQDVRRIQRRVRTPRSTRSSTSSTRSRRTPRRSTTSRSSRRPWTPSRRRTPT